MGHDGPHARLLRAAAMCSESTLRMARGARRAGSHRRPAAAATRSSRLPAMQALLERQALPPRYVQAVSAESASKLAGVTRRTAGVVLPRRRLDRSGRAGSRCAGHAGRQLARCDGGATHRAPRRRMAVVRRRRPGLRRSAAADPGQRRRRAAAGRLAARVAAAPARPGQLRTERRALACRASPWPAAATCSPLRRRRPAVRRHPPIR